MSWFYCFHACSLGFAAIISMLKELNDDPGMFYIKQHQALVLAGISLFKQRNLAFDFSLLSYN